MISLLHTCSLVTNTPYAIEKSSTIIYVYSLLEPTIGFIAICALRLRLLYTDILSEYLKVKSHEVMIFPNSISSSIEMSANSNVYNDCYVLKFDGVAIAMVQPL